MAARFTPFTTQDGVAVCWRGTRCKIGRLDGDESVLEEVYRGPPDRECTDRGAGRPDRGHTDVLASNRSKYVDAGCPDTILAAEFDSVRGDVTE